jgi:thioredoxin
MRQMFALFVSATILLAAPASCNRYSSSSYHNGGSSRTPFLPGRRLAFRGGDQEETGVQELSLEQKVQAAMHKLGIVPPPPPPPFFEEEDVAYATEEDGCVDGVCPVPAEAAATEEESTAVAATEEEESTAIEEESTVTEEESTAVAVAETALEPEHAAEEAEISAELEEIAAELEESAAAEAEIAAEVDPSALANSLAEELNLHVSLVWAALGATSIHEDDGRRSYDETAARQMIQQEIDMIAQVQEDSAQVQQLVGEGFDTFLSRRALAFAEMNMEDARAILLADQMDEEEEAREEEARTQASPKEEAFKTVNVDANFDPSKISTETAPPAVSPAPSLANKADVVFDATAAQIQELVLESPVPVLLDVYADWCGPCKQLTPILEEMAVKAGGAFRLIKINSDTEKAISSALQVTALPTVFAVNNGKILNMFQGMPRSQEAMKNFMMGLLVPGTPFNPLVTAQEQETYNELSTKLVKTAGAACFPFSARERLQDRMMARLDDLAKDAGVLKAEEAAQTIRSLLINVIQNPYEAKYRTVNLSNKVLANKVAQFPAAVAILKTCGFVPGKADSALLALGKGKKLVNVAPLSVARDCIDKWVDTTRYEVAKAARRRKDEEDRQKLQLVDVDDESEEEEEEEVDPNACTLSLRMDGKKKVHSIELQAGDPLSAVLDQLPVPIPEGREVQITCVAKRLVVKSSDTSKMSKSLLELGLAPAAAIVVKVGTREKKEASSGRLSERAAAQKKKKTGSHSYHSIGVYAKDDNNKGELVDGGGGTCYEQDVSDDEEEAVEEEEQVESSADTGDETDSILDSEDE